MELMPGASLQSVAWSDLQAGHDALARALCPADATDILKSLAACDAVTTGREGDPFDAKARATVFARDLAEFPAEAVRAAFREHARNSRWRPTLAEIRALCAAQVQPTRDAVALVRAEMARRNQNQAAS